MEWFGLSNEYFDFDMFSKSHFFVLAIFFLAIVLIYVSRKKMYGEKWRRIEIGLAFTLILIEIINHVWMYVNGVWEIGRSMPLELCNIALILCMILLLSGKRVVFELLFFISLLGATQAIITPALTYDFPHFRFFHFFYAHMMVVWVSLYFIWAKGYYPTFRSVIKLVIFINLLLPVILFVNKQAEGNYWFLRHKPDTPSFLDLLGPYPLYIFSLEGLLITLSIVVWLVLRKRVKNHSRRPHADY